MASSEGATDDTDKGRRRFLTLTTTAVGAVGAGFVVWPFIQAWQPSARARAAGAPVEVNLAKIEPGQMLRVQWRGTIATSAGRWQKRTNI